MQIKKIDIKMRIKQTATEMLLITKFKDVSMRDVAKSSNMTVGNIYRYYENKEILFDEIVGETYSNLIKLVKITEFVKKFMKNKTNINEKTVYKNTRFKTFVLKQILKIVCDNTKELYILINTSEGSKYQDTAKILFEMIKNTILKMIANISEDEAETYAFITVSTLSFLLKKHINDSVALQNALEKFCIKLFESF